MKISKKYLQKIIKEEIELLILEQSHDNIRAYARAEIDQARKRNAPFIRALQNILNGRDMKFLLKTAAKLPGDAPGGAREFSMGIKGVNKELRDLIAKLDDLDLS